MSSHTPDTKTIFVATDDTQSVSVAQTYTQQRLQTQVNPRTGSLGVSIASPPLQGILSMDINLSITYAQGTTTPVQMLFGLPPGWSYSLSYIWNNAITINGNQTYIIDRESPSGLQYYYKQDIFLDSYSPQNYPKLPYGTNPEYAYKLHFLDGHNQYFDAMGKLICWDDKNGNHQIFGYDQENASITQAKLISVVDTYGQTITITFDADSIEVAYPQSKANQIRFAYVTSKGSLVSYTDPLGNITTLTYGGGLVRNNLLSQIVYPNQLVTTVSYSTLYFLDSSGTTLQQDVVSAIRNTYQHETRSTTYDYDPPPYSGTHYNYLGYPTYRVVNGTDSLFDSNDNSYRYRTAINNGITQTINEYNRLHLLLKSTVFTPDGRQTISETVTTYPGEEEGGYFPANNQLDPNYQLPAETLTTFYNQEGGQRAVKTTRSYNSSGQTACVMQYEQVSKQFQPVKQTTAEYDGRFGLPTLFKIEDYKPAGILTETPNIIRIDNSLTTDGKHIASCTLGTEAGGQPRPEIVTNIEYDSTGRSVSCTRSWASTGRPGIQSTRYSLEYLVDTSQHVFTRRKTDYLGNTMQEAYDLATGFVILKSNALGAGIVYEYDNLGRIIKRSNPVGVVTTWEYDTANNKLTKTNANGYVVYETYNGFGQLVQQSDNLGDAGSERILTTKTYDEVGRLSTTSGILGSSSSISFLYDTRSLLSSKTDAIGNASSYAYDSVARARISCYNDIQVDETNYDKNGQITSIVSFDTYATGSQSNLTKLWNGFQLNVQTSFGDGDDPDQYVQTTNYDLTKQPVQGTLAGNGDQRILVATRDLLGKILQSTCTVNRQEPPISSSTLDSSKRIYNEIGQLLQETTGSGESRSFAYDAAGNMTLLTNFDKSQVTNTYYPDNRLKSRRHLEDASIIEICHQYNDMSLPSCIERFVDGHSEGSISYEYTPDGKVTSISYPDGKRIAWDYSTDTNLVSGFTDALGNVSTYSYDPYGKLTEIARKDGSARVSLMYVAKQTDPANSGKLASIVYSNGIRINYTYDGYGSIRQITTQDDSGNDPVIVSYTYDTATKFVISESYRCASGTKLLNRDVSYSYDGIGRLIGMASTDPEGNHIETISYTYDAATNVTTRTIKTPHDGSTEIAHQYDADNRLISVSIGEKMQFLEYDANGNLTLDENGNTYRYNSLNQLIRYTTSKGETTVYTYYPNGLRATKKTGSDEEIRYYYDHAGNANIVNEIQGDDHAGYLMSGIWRFVRLFGSGTSVTAQYYLPGPQNTILTFDATGSISSENIYDPYGYSKSKQGASLGDNPFGYRREYTDMESGLIYLRARYYAPKLTRFVSRDSFLTFNPYEYANGNPVMNSDASGHLSTGANIGIMVGLTLVTVAATALTAGAAGPELAAADAAEIGGTAAGASATAADDAAAAGDMALDSAGVAANGGVEIASSADETVSYGFNGFGDVTNATGQTDNCVFCTAGYLSGQTSTDVANAVGMDEGLVPDNQVMQVFQQVGLTTASNFDLSSTDAMNAYSYMASQPSGTEFAFGYQPDDGTVGHFLVAQSQGWGEPIQFVDPQINSAFAQLPAENLPYRYTVIRVDSQMAQITNAFSRLSLGSDVNDLTEEVGNLSIPDDAMDLT